MRGSLTLANGAVVTSNTTALEGGGIYVAADSTLILENGSEISDYEAVTGTGGGVSMTGSSQFNMSGGRIENNIATTFAYGRGIAVANTATSCTLEGSTFLKPTNDDDGGDDIYLLWTAENGFKPITINGELSEHNNSNKIHITFGVRTTELNNTSNFPANPQILMGLNGQEGKFAVSILDGTSSATPNSDGTVPRN